jgi:hypothetical protein
MAPKSPRQNQPTVQGRHTDDPAATRFPFSDRSPEAEFQIAKIHGVG